MKNKINYLVLLLTVALGSFWSCTDDIEGITPDEPEVIVPESAGLQVKNKYLLFDASGVALGVNLRSVEGKWQAYPAEGCDWVEKISPEEGEAGNNVIGITLQENEGMEERSGFVVIKHLGTGDTVHVTIRQYTHESKYTRQTDSIALVAIYDALTQSSEWMQPWDLKKPITTWSGLEFEEIKGEKRVVGINTREYQIYGELPNELGNLRELKKLAITGGSLTGRIPVTITSLRKLEEINIPFREGYVEWYVPENVGDMKALKTLSVGYLKIAPDFFKNLYQITTLERISLSSFEGDLPEGISALANLKELDLSYSKVASLPQDFGNLASLENLNLSGCRKLTRLSDNLGQLPKLTTLQLMNAASLETLPENIGDLTALTTFSMNGCEALVAIPESFVRLPLSTLNLSNCSKLEQLPAQIGTMNRLTGMNLTGCESLQALPESFCQLTGLTKLELANCTSLTTLPAAIGDLQNVTEIVMTSCNGFTDFPESLGRLAKLIKFSFTTTNTVNLPSGFANLTNLEEFSCNQPEAGAGISADLSVFKNFTNLKTLKASNNQFTGDLSILGQLPNLQTVEMESNRFTLALDLTKILTSTMKTVKLSNNGLVGTLSGITLGTALTTLYLDNNRISGEIPEDIKLCSKLTYLYLSDNQITGTLPVALIDLPLSWSGLKLMRNNMSGTIDEAILNSNGWKSKWYPKENILPQNEGYGFTGF